MVEIEPYSIQSWQFW